MTDRVSSPDSQRVKLVAGRRGGIRLPEPEEEQERDR